jgi:hypothetical protein
LRQGKRFRIDVANENNNNNKLCYKNIHFFSKW